jgi:CrcB protein
MGLATTATGLIAPTTHVRSAGGGFVAVVLLVGLGGFAGAIARYVVDRRVTEWAGGALPWGTVVINVVGSFVVGILFALIVERAALSPTLRAPLMIGFLGAFTTFSTWMLASWRMVEDGAWFLAALNLGGSILVGMVAVVAGVVVGRAL